MGAPYIYDISRLRVNLVSNSGGLSLAGNFISNPDGGMDVSLL